MVRMSDYLLSVNLFAMIIPRKIFKYVSKESLVYINVLKLKHSPITNLTIIEKTKKKSFIHLK